MPVLSYIHHLFDAEHCQAYIHTLRWKDRPLQCPRCQSQDVDPWGTYHYRPGCKRSWCKGCKRTFNDLTHTLLHQSRRSCAYWILATFLLCLSCSSRRIAREVGVHSRTSYRWCWWLRNAALSYEMDRQLAGTIEADELYHTAGHKGQAPQGGKKLANRPRHASLHGVGARKVRGTRISRVATPQRHRGTVPGSIQAALGYSRPFVVSLRPADGPLNPLPAVRHNDRDIVSLGGRSCDFVRALRCALLC